MKPGASHPEPSPPERDDRSGRWVAVGWILALTVAAETLTFLTFLCTLIVLGWLGREMFVEHSWPRALEWAGLAVLIRIPVTLVAKPALTIYMQWLRTRSLLSMEALDAAITFSIMYYLLREHLVSRPAAIEVCVAITVVMAAVSVFMTKPWRQTGDNVLGG